MAGRLPVLGRSLKGGAPKRLVQAGNRAGGGWAGRPVGIPWGHEIWSFIWVNYNDLTATEPWNHG